MKTILKSHGLWDLVENGFNASDPKKEKKEIEETKIAEKSTMTEILMKDARALGLIQSVVSDQLFRRIVNEETSKGSSDILKLEFRGDKQDLETLEVQEVVASLKSSELRLDRHTENSTEMAFTSLNIEGENPKSGGSSGDQKSQKNWKSNDGNKTTCKHCDKLHYGKCWFEGKPKCKRYEGESLMGVVKENEETKVYKLNKALYGLKQAPRAWYDEIDSYFNKSGFKKSPSEATLYVKTSEASGSLIASLYVDDIVYTGSCPKLLEEFKNDMMQHYEMTDLGLLHHFLGMGVVQTDKHIFLHQKKYAVKINEKFGLKDCKSVATPLVANERLCKEDGSESANESEYKQVVGSLLYLTATRPDIMFASSLLARFIHNPTRKHMGTAKRVLRYIHGTLDFGIEFVKGKTATLIGYCDSD
ncbi:hypothetical protein L3X38_041472 [Prunus dulcis]|uniref:Reverse transcriptase Ty1/copia-type domain-containing protein n=1 Tax=Prunus dulcis TaxID=3755 RepID=A0AAD4UT44_PRUDU|nr:hypothetical protein L3X38_041472 [Prunus dulcis]